jgi:hypothetical protein
MANQEKHLLRLLRLAAGNGRYHTGYLGGEVSLAFIAWVFSFYAEASLVKPRLADSEKHP